MGDRIDVDHFVPGDRDWDEYARGKFVCAPEKQPCFSSSRDQSFCKNISLGEQ